MHLDKKKGFDWILTGLCIEKASIMEHKMLIKTHEKS